jgi:hypothetical protein
MSTKYLIDWFAPIDHIFKVFKCHTLDYKDRSRRRIYIDTGGKVLLVAHLDTVQTPCYRWRNHNQIYATGLDDRLGCWLAYTLSQEFGADLLLTDNEERAMSTARKHVCKDYNWIVEFDRAGADVVTYDLDSAEFLAALNKYFTIGAGSFSDLVFLDTDACCVNIGIGHNDMHNKNAFVDIRVMNWQINQFKQFYRQYVNTKFVRDQQSDIETWPTENPIWVFCDNCCGYFPLNEMRNYHDSLLCLDCISDFTHSEEYKI